MKQNWNNIMLNAIKWQKWRKMVGWGTVWPIWRVWAVNVVVPVADPELLVEAGVVAAHVGDPPPVLVAHVEDLQERKQLLVQAKWPTKRQRQRQWQRTKTKSWFIHICCRMNPFTNDGKRETLSSTSLNGRVKWGQAQCLSIAVDSDLSRTSELAMCWSCSLVLAQIAMNWVGKLKCNDCQIGKSYEPLLQAISPLVTVLLSDRIVSPSEAWVEKASTPFSTNLSMVSPTCLLVTI